MRCQQCDVHKLKGKKELPKLATIKVSGVLTYLASIG